MDTAVSGTPRVLLRLEGLALLVAAVVGYSALHASWLQFALLLLLPDVAIAAYLAGPRVGAAAYNALHTLLGPFLVAVLAYTNVLPDAWPVCLIWIAHIGMDRALGLGLKFPNAFQSTHLGTVGARPAGGVALLLAATVASSAFSAGTRADKHAEGSYTLTDSAGVAIRVPGNSGTENAPYGLRRSFIHRTTS